MEQKEIAVAVNIVTKTHFVLRYVQKKQLMVQKEMAMDQVEEIVKGDQRRLFAMVMEVVEVYIIINKNSKKLVINMIVYY